MGTIIITKQQYEAYEAVRESGATNMFALNDVIRIAEQMAGVVLTREEVLDIMNNYRRYSLRHKAGMLPEKEEDGELKVVAGQYDETDGRFAFRYIVYRVMKRTAEVLPLTSIDGGDYRGGSRVYRYPLDLLKKQLKDAAYTPFREEV
jgi:hypothetical protein